MKVAKYNAKDTVITVDGVYLTGLAEDFVTGSKDEDYFSAEVGAQGDVLKNEINNDLGTVEVTVQSTSPQVPFLKSLKKRSEPFPVWCSNKLLGERFGGTSANLKSDPEVSRGASCDNLTFTFQVFDYVNDAI